MSFCTACGVYFNGRGRYCTLHNPYIQSYNYSSDVMDPSSIKYRTSHYRNISQPRKQRQIGFRDSYDALDTYNQNTSLTKYSNHTTTPYSSLSDPITHPTVLNPLTSTFTHLTHAHAITSLTYSISPTGTRSITATANPDREQCSICLLYFPDRERLDTHMWEFPVGCETHRVCLRGEDVAWHAEGWRHERCFVRGCGSVYRREGGWKGTVVEGHVRGWHA